MFLKGIFNLRCYENNINKRRDRIDSQVCHNLMKTHRTQLRVVMNNKDGSIMH